MSISSVGFGNSDVHSLFQQRRADFNAMANAVKSGDMTTAGTALTAYQKDAQNIQAQFNGNGSFTTPAGSDKLQADLTSLASSIQSGSSADATSALQTFQQDRASLRGDHRGSAPSTTGAASSSSSSASAVGNDIAKLIQDSQSGDATAVQTDTAALTKDLQSLTGNGSQVQGAGGHGHHHHHGGVQSGTGGSAQVAAAGGSGGGGDGDGDGDGSAKTAAGALGTTSAQQLAIDQYQISMTLLQESASSSTSTSTAPM